MADILQDNLLQADERRRSPRFFCSGPARISYLPSNGKLLSGVLRNLSRGGCYVETVSPLPCGARAEILLRVNAESLRAAGRISTMHEHRGMGIEFQHLSAAGRSILSDLLRELARINSQMHIAKVLRREAEDALVQKSLGPLVLMEASGGLVPAEGTIVPSESGETQPPVATREVKVTDGPTVANWLDLFA